MQMDTGERAQDDAGWAEEEGGQRWARCERALDWLQAATSKEDPDLRKEASEVCPEGGPDKSDPGKHRVWRCSGAGAGPFCALGREQEGLQQESGAGFRQGVEDDLDIHQDQPLASRLQLH